MLRDANSDWLDFNEHIAKTQLTDAPLAGASLITVQSPIISDVDYLVQA